VRWIGWEFRWMKPKRGLLRRRDFHLNRQENALDYMRANIDAWWPHIEAARKRWS